MAKPMIRKAPQDPGCSGCAKAYLVLSYAHETAAHFLKVFDEPGGQKRAKGGPTDEEQDVLRAMVVFAAAGLDSMLKQLIRDTLPALVEQNEEVKDRLESFVGDRLLRLGDKDGRRFMTGVLLASSSHEACVEALVGELTSHSLQSYDELLRVAAHLDLGGAALGHSKADLKGVLDARNNIVHEMDIDFEQPKRNRRTHRRDDMVGYANVLLNTADNVLQAVAKKL